MPEHKHVSVAMCTYNGERYLKEQLESIANQTRLPSEIVICDDRSTDATLRIVETFAKTAPLRVVVHVNDVNVGGSSRGITRNFERTIQRCSGDLIACCDQDDVWMPHKVDVLARMFEQDPQLGCAFSDAELITADGLPKGMRLSQAIGLTARDRKRLKQGQALAVPLAMNKIYGSSLMFSSRLVEKIVPVPPHWWFDAWVGTVAASYAKLLFTPEPLFYYRIHANQDHGASAAATSERMRQWKRSPKEFWEDCEPQLTELYARLEKENTPQMEPHLAYLRGRMTLLRERTELPPGRIRRSIQVLRRAPGYVRYFNGWRSIVKDLTA
ncbi:MAG TPA: glycosyltransferase [Acidobacteriaceae bacterium]|jgi:glycosyltransferase involved in cell wall biosynthesis|nr:glycosyltransferase [Acidobacteriaceae bacterium]